MSFAKNGWLRDLAHHLIGSPKPKRPKRSRRALRVEQLESRTVLANSTSFEFTDTDEFFTLFDPPEQATFENAEAKTVGNFNLYHSGFHAWMIDAGNTGVISLETPAEHVSLFLRNQTPAVQSVLTAFDTQNNIVDTINGTDLQWTEFTFTRTEGQLPIERIEVTNNATTSGMYAAVDDFSFTTDVTVGDPLEDPIPAAIPASSLDVQLTPVATGLIAPNWGTSAPGLDDRLFVTDQPGIVYSIDLAAGNKSVFLDASDRLVDLGIFGPGSFDERGLLGLAFHPNFAQNGLLYTYTSESAVGAADFSAPDGVANHQSVITEWRVFDSTDPDTSVDPNSARELIRIDQPQFNHNAGAMNFGPDGYLYISLGDGGAADDQGPGHSDGGNGQDPTNVLGSILRIDPLGDSSDNGEYGVPTGNPFVGNTDGIPEETFAFGFRNPFRFSFDQETGEMLVGDVGQNDIEEINRIDPVSNAGDNFGWSFKEGSFFFNDNENGPGFVTDVDPGNVPDDLVDPVLQYDHDEGISVIGGFVYRGTAIPELTGQFVFGDFSRTFDLSNPQGRLFFGDLDAGAITEATPDDFSRFILGFAQDAAGELYVLANETGVPFGDTQGNPTGAVYRIDPLEGGNVLAVFAARNLFLLGDGQDNVVDISLNSEGNVVIRGEEGTDIHLLSRQPHQAVDNSIELPGVSQIDGSLIAFLRGGDDTLKVQGVDVGRNVHLAMGFGAGGDDSVFLGGVAEPDLDIMEIGGRLGVFTGHGDNAVSTDLIDVGANAILLTGHGKDGVVLNNSTFGRSLHVSTGDDMDIAFLDGNSSVGLRTVFWMGRGDDALAIETDQLGRLVRLDGGSGLQDALSAPEGVRARRFELEDVPVLRFGAGDGNEIPLEFGGVPIGTLSGGLSNFAMIGKFYASPLFSRVAGPINVGGAPIPIEPVTLTFNQPVSAVKFFFIHGTGFPPGGGPIVVPSGTATAMLDNGESLTVSSNEATFLGDASNFVTLTAPEGRKITEVAIEGGVMDNLIVIP